MIDHDYSKSIISGENMYEMFVMNVRM